MPQKTTARMPKGKVRLNIYLTEELAERLGLMLEVRGGTMSTLIEDLLGRALPEEGPHGR